MHAVLDILCSIPGFVVLACVASLAFERKGDRRNMIEGTMESIEKLRESSHLDDSKWTLETGEVIHVYGSEPNDPNAVNWGEQWRKIADEIEREIESRYMQLPVDADGVPIHVNDWIEVYDKKPSDKRQRVEAVATHSVFWWEKDGCHWTQGFMCRHAKPRTIEGVLKAFFHDALDADTFCTVRLDDVLAKYAAEIRELMEVDR